jgi:hypothetical protein
MKKYFFLIMIAVLTISGCSLFAPKPSSIQEVEEFRAKDIGDSGASEVPSNEGEVVQVFASIDTDTDPLLKDIFNSNDAKSLFSQRALKYAKSLGSSFASQISEIQGDIEDFPTTKQIDATINLSGETMGRYLVLTKGEGSLSATATTGDNNPIAEDFSNLKSLSGETALQIEINATDELADASSAIKDIRLKLNEGGSGSLSMKKNSDGTYTPDKITLDYRESLGFGLAVNANGKGGKIVVKEDASFSGSIAYSTVEASADNPDELAVLLMPQITIIVKVYDDNNQLMFSNSYASIAEFRAAFNLDS